MIDCDIRTENLQTAIGLTPTLESPTISNLHCEGWNAVRTMVPVDHAQTIQDDLETTGAKAILATRIDACRI